MLCICLAEAEEQQALLREKQYRDQEELRRSMYKKCEDNDAKWKLSSDREQYKKVCLSTCHLLVLSWSTI